MVNVADTQTIRLKLGGEEFSLFGEPSFSLPPSGYGKRCHGTQYGLAFSPGKR